MNLTTESFLGLHTNKSGQRFIAMEYLPKGSLDEVIRSKKEDINQQDLIGM